MWQKQLDSLLLQFGQDLKHSDKYHEEAVKLTNGVFEKLKQNLRNYKILETHFAGSFGKKTDVLFPDLDLVVVVHFNGPQDYEKSREKVLNQFHNILCLQQKHLQINDDDIVEENNIVAFSFKNGLEVDLMVAADFTKDVVYNEIRKNPKKWSHFYSPCLMKLSLEFMRAQDSFTHSLVRVLRFWYKMLHVNVYGGKLMIDLVGVAAAMKQSESRSILSGLAAAFQWISKLDTVKIAFVQDGRKWRLSDREPINITAESGFIMDPSNPFNNLLANVKPEAMKTLKHYAGLMGDRLSNAMRGNADFVKLTNGVPQIDIFKLFTPRKANLKNMFPTVAEPKKFSFHHSFRAPSAFPSLQVWNESCFKRPDIKAFVNAFKWDLLARVNSTQSMTETPSNTGFSAGSQSQPYPNIKTATDSIVKEMIETSLGMNLGGFGHSARDEDYDVTITVPYQVGKEYYAVKVNLQW